MPERPTTPDRISRRTVAAIVAAVVVVAAVIVVARVALRDDGSGDTATTVDVAPPPTAPDVTAPGTNPPATDPPSTTAPATDPPSTMPDETAVTIDPGTTDPATTDPITTDPAEPEGLPGAMEPPPATPLPPIAQFAEVALHLEPVLDIANLTGMRWSPLDDAYYAITQDGMVHRIPPDLASSEVVLDMSAEVTELLPGSERGLLGIAFDPADGRMFLHFTDRSDDSHVVSHEMVDGRPVAEARRHVLHLDQPGLGHQGGDMHFDAEGRLFVAFGDGGGSNGRDAQDDTKLHGSIIRIVPNREGDGYDVPDDNPFVDDPDRLDELWATGLRNPWRFTIDPSNGDIWIGDVGDSTLESVNRIPSGVGGLNFGWYWFEGTHDRGRGPVPDGLELTPPVYEYGRSVGVSVIGGEVYHGSAIPELTGAYVFADMSGPFFGIGSDGGTRLQLNGPGPITGFVVTPDHELLVLTLQRGLVRLVPG